MEKTKKKSVEGGAVWLIDRRKQWFTAIAAESQATQCACFSSENHERQNTVLFRVIIEFNRHVFFGGGYYSFLVVVFKWDRKTDSGAADKQRVP